MGPEQGQKYTTSFIPKKPVYTQPAGRVKSGGPNLLTIIGVIFFLGSIFMLAGVYVWSFQIEKTIETQVQTLQRAKDEFDERTIAAATRLNERIIAVQDLLDNHKSPSELLRILENITLETVRLRDLKYVTEDDGRIHVTGSGIAIGFESVVLQSDELGDSGFFRDTLFSEVQSGTDGGLVTFSMDTMVEENLVLYRKKLDSQFGADDLEVFDEEADAASSRNIFKK